MNRGIIFRVKLTHPAVLLSEHYYKRLWLAVRNTTIPRRDWLDELANTLRDFNGEIYQADNRPYEIPLVDDVFNDDYDMRWLGYYLKSDDTGCNPQLKCRKIERLQLLDLYFKIKYPKIAKHFDQ